MLRSRYAIFLPMKAVFTTAAGALTGRRDACHRAVTSGRGALMGQTVGVLSFVICLNMAAHSMALAADAGEQDFAKGESLLKQKQYAEARAMLEAGLIKNSSNVQAHFNLAEACRRLTA